MIGAVDIGGTKIAVGMLNDAGETLSRLECPTEPERGAVYGKTVICEMLREAAFRAGGKLCGVGIGCTGPVNPLTGQLGNVEFLPGWEGLNLPEYLSQVFGVGAAIENDADAAALAEAAWGSGKGAERFIYVTISTGIGGGIVLNGQLYRGANGSHPEIGHHVIDPAGPHCFCGANGCWESLASGPALAKRGKKATALEVCQAATLGDPDALRAVEEEGRYLGIGLANLITLFMPDVIALGGGVMKSSELFLDNIKSVIRTSCGLVPYEDCSLLTASLGSDVALAGAAQVWIKRFGQKI